MFPSLKKEIVCERDYLPFDNKKFANDNDDKTFPQLCSQI